MRSFFFLPGFFFGLVFFWRGVEPVNTKLAAPAAKVSDPGGPFQDPNTADRSHLQVLGFLSKMIEKYPNKDRFYNMVRVLFQD